MSELKQLFSTPMLVDKIHDKELLDKTVLYILSSFDATREFQHDRRILSQPELHEFRDKIVYPAFDKFLEQTGITRNNKNIRLSETTNFSSWSSLNKNYEMRIHNHNNAQVSAIFYLLCEEQDKGGKCVFWDPRGNANRGYDDEWSNWFKCYEHQPKTGDILIFPSYLFHSVDTFTGNMRLCLPVDFCCENFDWENSNDKD